MSSKAEKAAVDFGKGFNCSQAVLGVFADEAGLDKKLAMKVSSGFGGGIARSGDICGVVTGAIMALGLKFFLTEADIKQEKAKIYGIVAEFENRFKKRHGSILCRELLGYNVSTADGAKKIAELDLHNKVCAGLVWDAVEIVEEMSVQGQKRK